MCMFVCVAIIAAIIVVHFDLITNVNYAATSIRRLPGKWVKWKITQKNVRKIKMLMKTSGLQT